MKLKIIVVNKRYFMKFILFFRDGLNFGIEFFSSKYKEENLVIYMIC